MKLSMKSFWVDLLGAMSCHSTLTLFLPDEDSALRQLGAVVADDHVT